VVLFSVQDGPWVPTLRLLHKYPIAMPHFQVDRGAIRHRLHPTFTLVNRRHSLCSHRNPRTHTQ